MDHDENDDGELDLNEIIKTIDATLREADENIVDDEDVTKFATGIMMSGIELVFTDIDDDGGGTLDMQELLDLLDHWREETSAAAEAGGDDDDDDDDDNESRAFDFTAEEQLDIWKQLVDDGAEREFNPVAEYGLDVYGEDQHIIAATPLSSGALGRRAGVYREISRVVLFVVGNSPMRRSVAPYGSSTTLCIAPPGAATGDLGGGEAHLHT